MRVDNIFNAYKVYNTNGNPRQRRAGSVVGQNQDGFSLSVKAEDYKVARKAVSAISEVRQDRVDDIRARIESGQYNVSASMVAEKILQNAII